MKQFETLRFVASVNGQSRKVAALNLLSQRGWQIIGETIEQGHTKGGEACCLALICLPLGFAAGRTHNVSVVTIERDVESVLTPVDHQHQWARLDDNRIFCLACEVQRDQVFG
jgi:hypothetical protein